MAKRMSGGGSDADVEWAAVAGMGRDDEDEMVPCDLLEPLGRSFSPTEIIKMLEGVRAGEEQKRELAAAAGMPGRTFRYRLSRLRSRTRR